MSPLDCAGSGNKVEAEEEGLGGGGAPEGESALVQINTVLLSEAVPPGQ